MAEQDSQQEITGKVSEPVVLPPSDYLAEVTLIKPKTLNTAKGPSEVLEFTFKLLDGNPNAKSNIAHGIAGFRDKKIEMGKPLYKWCSILAGQDIAKDKDFKISSLVGKKCKVTTENNPGKGTYSNFTFINVKEILALKPRDLEYMQTLGSTQAKTTPTAQSITPAQAPADVKTTPAPEANKTDENFF